MRKLYLILLFAMLLPSVFAATSYYNLNVTSDYQCYQESQLMQSSGKYYSTQANTSTAYDNKLSTTQPNMDSELLFYVNYTIPNNLRNATVSVYLDFPASFIWTTAGWYNYTIPTSCMDNKIKNVYDNKLQLRYFWNADVYRGGDGATGIKCYNGNTWYEFKDDLSGTRIWESHIVWDYNYPCYAKSLLSCRQNVSNATQSCGTMATNLPTNSTTAYFNNYQNDSDIISMGTNSLFNYTKPQYLTSAKLETWNVYSNFGEEYKNITRKNISILSSCLSYNPTKVLMNKSSYTAGAPTYLTTHYLSCKNGTWQNIDSWLGSYSAPPTTYFRRFAEEGMYWQLSKWYNQRKNNISYPTTINMASNFTSTLRINLTGITHDYYDVNATITYNGTNYAVTKTSDVNFIYFSRVLTSPSVASSKMIKGIWNVSLNPIIYNVTRSNFTFSQYVVGLGINNCSTGDKKALQVTFYNEDSLNKTNAINFNIDFDIIGGDETSTLAYGLKFIGNNSYGICIANKTSVLVDARMEYSNGIYTDRKYYLYNYTIDNTTDTLNLYALNNTKSSEVIATVYDKMTGDRTENAYVKLLRYYPETSTYRTVEIEKSNNKGQVLLKMILADVWYKYLVEYPGGTVKYNGGVEKAMDVEKLLPISLRSQALLSYNKVLGISGDVSCTKSSKTCRFTWSDASNIATTGELRIYRDNGYRKTMIYSTTLNTAAGSIAYVIPENITGKKYLAEGWIYTNE